MQFFFGSNPANYQALAATRFNQMVRSHQPEKVKAVNQNEKPLLELVLPGLFPVLQSMQDLQEDIVQSARSLRDKVESDKIAVSDDVRKKIIPEPGEEAFEVAGDEILPVTIQLIKQNSAGNLEALQEKAKLIDEIANFVASDLLVYSASQFSSAVSFACSNTIEPVEEVKVEPGLSEEEAKKAKKEKTRLELEELLTNEAIEISAKRPPRAVRVDCQLSPIVPEVMLKLPLIRLIDNIAAYEKPEVLTLVKLLRENDIDLGDDFYVSSNNMSLSRESAAPEPKLASMQQIIDAIDSKEAGRVYRQKLHQADSSLRELVDKCRFYVYSQKILEGQPLDKKKEEALLNMCESSETKALRGLLAKAGLKEWTQRDKDHKASMKEMIARITDNDNQERLKTALQGRRKLAKKLDNQVNKCSLFLSLREKCENNQKLDTAERLVFLEAHTRFGKSVTQKHRGNILQIIGHYLAWLGTVLPAKLLNRQEHSRLSKSEQTLEKQKEEIKRVQERLGFFTAKREKLAPRPAARSGVSEQKAEAIPEVPVTPEHHNRPRSGGSAG
ncbi:MAG TPA: hypothetical protein VLJ15_05540 [Gammaproteobacteria bacterium]|nr:hypothetical protein [Gammaproteobacteria bacterium]